MTIGMGRRGFLTALYGATVWPLTARAQHPAWAVIGFLHSASPDQYKARLIAYREGLAHAGFVEGHNVAIEFRWADGHDERLPGFAADLVQRQVDVIAAPGSISAALAAKRATTSIPIVFATGADPVAIGLVASLNRPGGNITGITALNAQLATKRLSLVRSLVPRADRVFTLVNPDGQLTESFIKDLQAAASSVGLTVDILRARSPDEIEAVFAGLPQRPDSVLLVSTDTFLFNRHDQIIALAAQRKLPAIYDNREIVEAGGLISYGTDFLDVLRQAGNYTSRVLKGENPADLPVHTRNQI